MNNLAKIDAMRRCEGLCRHLAGAAATNLGDEPMPFVTSQWLEHQTIFFAKKIEPENM